MTKRTDFTYSTEQEPHRGRTKAILKKHPEVRNLIGKNPYSFLIILLVVGLQIFIAWLLKDASWWWIIGTAYLFGAFANHSMFVMIHEASHNLLFKKRLLNRVAGIIANLPQSFPTSESFRIYHLKHHSFQGVYELDADLPAHWEAKLINNYFIGKTLWLLLYPFFQITRTFRINEVKKYDEWVVINWVVQFAFDALILWLLGPHALVYFLLSFFFSIGFHPIGARWVQEHYLTFDSMQETYSYYGILNWIQFDIGYHNEHHDFPSIPWNNLKKLKKAAPESYDTLKYHRSWTKLFFRFLFDQEISLYARLVRKNRGNVALSDESKPDVEYLSTNK